jgi:hypothetical protein
VKSPNNPDGLPIFVLDRLRISLVAYRPEFFYELASEAFYGFNGFRQPCSGPQQANPDLLAVVSS